MGAASLNPPIKRQWKSSSTSRGSKRGRTPEQKIYYKGQKLVTYFVPDFVCFGKIVVELKAVANICDEHVGQLLGYLKATGYKLGFLVNFGHHPDLEIKRFVK